MSVSDNLELSTLDSTKQLREKRRLFHDTQVYATAAAFLLNQTCTVNLRSNGWKLNLFEFCCIELDANSHEPMARGQAAQEIEKTCVEICFEWFFEKNFTLNI